MVIATLTAVAAQQAAPPVYAPGNGVSLPVVVKEVPPEYTQEAKDARIEGTCCSNVWCWRMERSATSRETVARFKLGLDQEAVSMKQWQFRPGTKDGKPVAVRVQIESTFTLR